MGIFTLKGLVRLTPNQIEANAQLRTEIGEVASDMQIMNIYSMDYAQYQGDVTLKNFDIGFLLNNPLFGKVSLKTTLDGTSFLPQKINTSFVGNIDSFFFKGYNYKNIKTNGYYQNNKFQGKLIIDEPNFKMNFNGLADLSVKKI